MRGKPARLFIGYSRVIYRAHFISGLDFISKNLREVRD